MAFQAPRSSSKSRRQTINVTPLIDVVLVLLIVFFTISPVTMRSMPSNVADVDATGAIATEPVRITFYSDGVIVIDDGTQTIETFRIHLARELLPILEQRRGNKDVVVDVAKAVPYGDAIGVMDTIKGIGAGNIALAVNPGH